MKTFKIISSLIAVTIFTISAAMAFGDKFTEAMKKNIDAMNAAQTNDEIQNAVNTFDRIGDAEKSRWEPFYYASFGYVTLANREKDGAKKDAYLDLSLADLQKAKALVPEESEVIALEGFIHMMRVTVDPASRGQQYSGMAFQAFGKAVALNPENPRALSLLAQMQYGTAQFFGSATTEACSTLAKALEKFDTYKTDSVIAPQWGRKMAEGLKSKCN